MLGEGEVFQICNSRHTEGVQTVFATKPVGVASLNKAASVSLWRGRYPRANNEVH